MTTNPEPSVKALILSCILSTLLAIIILFVAVLPAEFNIDLTGLGEKLGLTVLSKTADTAEKPTVISCPAVDSLHRNSNTQQVQTTRWKDTVIINLPAKKELEYKFHISKDENFKFAWSTEGAQLYFDFHGEPEGDKTGYFKSFKESTDNQSSGILSVPFTGSHGWYWKNKTNQAVTIILKTSGNYKIIGLI